MKLLKIIISFYPEIKYNIWKTYIFSKEVKNDEAKVFENSYCEQGSSGNIMLLTLAMSISKNSVIEYYPLVYIYIYIYIYM